MQLPADIDLVHHTKQLELRMCREIMHAMWKPVKYKYVYVACTIYVLFITIPHSYALYWAYGDELLHKNNALGVLPDTMARDTALIFMIIHQVNHIKIPHPWKDNSPVGGQVEVNHLMNANC